nr:MAG TPA: hypothetical protein [Caudoviricetes sp.]
MEAHRKRDAEQGGIKGIRLKLTEEGIRSLGYL